MTILPFGTLQEGRAVNAVKLKHPGGLALTLLDYGATLHSLSVPVSGGQIEVLPNYPDLAGYESGKFFLNPAIGRFANRIANGRFSIGGEGFQVSCNEGANMLHGGNMGFDRRMWEIEQASAITAVLHYVSPDGEEGFPGQVEVRAEYTIASRDTLIITYSATSNRATPVNLTQHLYFNLSGQASASILDHTLRIAGPAFLPVREDLIPTGEICPVDGGALDLRQARRIGDVIAADDPQIKQAGGLDFNWVLDTAAETQVELYSPESALTLSISTDQPGMQVYSGQKLTAPFVTYGALALEPQGFPDSPNHPGFPDRILRPGQTYWSRNVYRFRDSRAAK
jgi:aldose 1-epimerase